MRLYSLVFTIFFILFFTNIYSQDIVVTKAPDSITHWKNKNMLGIDISEIAFLNWNAGGSSSVTALLKGHLKRDYENNNTVWKNELIFKYGLNMQEGNGIRKTDDVFRINSNYGHRTDTTSNWYHSAKFNFNTQFTNGYNYPNTDKAISKPFAPAYTFLGIGSEYINKKEKFSVYLSPLTFKNTLVLDQALANAGAFGVTKALYDNEKNLIAEGKKAKTEMGILVSTTIERKLYTNIYVHNKLSLYSDYINNFGNIDVDWQFKMDLIVNEYVKANIGFDLIYDDDIDTIKNIDGALTNVGPKVQLKQTLGIGLVYNF